MRVPTGSNARARGAVAARPADFTQDRSSHAGMMEGELLDLYGAMLIVVPVALFLKSLWM